MERMEYGGDLLPRVEIVCGDFGSGKTEFVLNKALEIARQRERALIVNLDSNNPYSMLRDLSNIHVLSPRDKSRHASLSSQIQESLSKEDLQVLIDLGGGRKGASVVGSLSHRIEKEEYVMYLLLNPFRPFTGTIKECSHLIHQMEASSHLQITHLIGNSNLGNTTTIDHIIEGYPLINDLSLHSQLPIRYLLVEERLALEAQELFSEEVLSLRCYLKPPWSKEGGILL